MARSTSPHSETTIGVSTATYEKVKSLKRGGITFDELVYRMARQYDPDAEE